MKIARSGLKFLQFLAFILALFALLYLRINADTIDTDIIEKSGATDGR